MKSFSYKEMYVEDGEKTLEINILPDKYCNFDCIFCPIGRSKNKVDIPQHFSESDSIISELAEVIETKKPNLIFINSKGEAFFNDNLDTIVDYIKHKGIKVKLFSNGYFLKTDEFKKIANKCDAVVGEIKTITEESFQKVQRPMQGYNLENYISNMTEFRNQYSGKFIFEITIIKGYNDDEASVSQLASIVKQLHPDKTIVVRMNEEPFKKKLGISDERFAEISNILLNI